MGNLENVSAETCREVSIAGAKKDIVMIKSTLRILDLALADGFIQGWMTRLSVLHMLTNGGTEQVAAKAPENSVFRAPFFVEALANWFTYWRGKGFFLDEDTVVDLHYKLMDHKIISEDFLEWCSR